MNDSLLDINFSQVAIGTNYSDIPPTHALSEYVSIIYQSFFLLIGVPLNVHALYSSLANLRTRTTSRFLILKLNLVVSDLMILLLYTVCEIAWAITFSWYGGTFACKLMKFLHLLTFILHSNIVVSIAVDRVFTITRIRQFNGSHINNRRAKILIISSWASAIVCSLPQLFVWTVDTPYPNWSQCSTIWEFEEHFGIITVDSQRQQVGYQLAHLLVVFYFPASFLIVAYIFTFIRFTKCLQEQNRFRSATVPSPLELTQMRTPLTRPTQLRSATPTGTPQPSTVSLRRGSIPNVALLKQRARSSSVAIWMNSGSPRTLRQTVILAVAYVVCYTPYNVCALWRLFASEDWRNGNYEAIIGFLDGPIILNAVIDPVLYNIAG